MAVAVRGERERELGRKKGGKIGGEMRVKKGMKYGRRKEWKTLYQ